jgi:general secretion pathway protein G
MKLNKRNKSIAPRVAGFTLVELLVVIAILGILATITVKIADNVMTGTTEAKAKGQLALISASLEKYKLKNSDYPNKATNNQLLKALLGFEDPNQKPFSKRKKAYIDSSSLTFTDEWEETADSGPPASTVEMLDPWGNPYVYKYDRVNDLDYKLYSKGPDGFDGTDDTDLDNINYRE